MTTIPATPLRDPQLEEQIRAYVAPRAFDLDACECTTREGIAHLTELGAVGLGVYGQSEAPEFERLCEVVATVAMDDMAQAFSLWCHRMALEYVHQAPDFGRRASLLSELTTTERIGSTSFASATSNFLAGTPLSLNYRAVEGGIVVNGNIAWASNLEPPFVSIAGASNAENPDERLVFAFTEATEGLILPAYPQVLALQSTNSTSPRFEEVFIPDEYVLTRDFTAFVARVLPTFLLLQSSFCWGLAARALIEACNLMSGTRTLFQQDLEILTERFNRAHDSLRAFATHPDRPLLGHEEMLALRLEFGTLATDAVRLEAKLAGGRGYMVASGTARRTREAAFLPVQSPTEVQLRWLLSRYA